MEVLQLTTRRPTDLGSSPHHLVEPGWLPLSHSSLPQSSSSSECGALGGHPPSLSALLQLSGNSSSVDPVYAYFHGAPPPPAPTREVDSNTKNHHVLFASPKVIHEQSMKYAKGALEHYNKRKKIKFELTGVMPVNSMPESCNFYTHVNFTAKSSKQVLQEQVFFAELQLCSRRRASSGFLVTCCEPLGPDYTVGHKGLQLDGSAVRKNIDFTRCFACSPRMLHPKGEKYIAGHCNIPSIYDSPY